MLRDVSGHQVILKDVEPSDLPLVTAVVIDGMPQWANQTKRRQSPSDGH
jgi:hypothetical protein